MKSVLCALALLAAAVSALAAAPVPWSGVVSRVTDGDTVWVRPDQGGRPRKVRITGIDAPELCQAHGAQARAALQRVVQRERVVVETLAIDDYRRPLVRLTHQGQDMARWMVLQGHAWSYRYRQNPGPYAREEAQARQARRGLFALPSPERPYDFRRRHGSCREQPPAEAHGNGRDQVRHQRRESVRNQVRGEEPPAGPQTGQSVWRGTRSVVQSMVRASSISSLPAIDWPAPLSSLIASAACRLPITPTSGASTPMVAQRVSSNGLSGGNKQA
jgi:micrococcal nuclease